MRMTKINLSYDELKRLVLQAIAQSDFRQYTDIESFISDYISKHNLSKETATYSSSFSQNYKELHSEDSDTIREIVWDLIIERILTLGFNSSNNVWPFLSLTNYGKKIFSEQTPILNDVDGIISLLKSSIKNVDDVIVKYMYECLNTYRIGANLASCVMLGCAAEKAISLLFQSYFEWLEYVGESKESNKFREMNNRTISKKFDEMVKSINGHKSSIDINALEDFELMVSSVFNIIRKNRNDAGHPTGNTINKDELSAWIHVFRIHCVRIYKLIDFFKFEVAK